MGIDLGYTRFREGINKKLSIKGTGKIYRIFERKIRHAGSRLYALGQGGRS